MGYGKLFRESLRAAVQPAFWQFGALITLVGQSGYSLGFSPGGIVGPGRDLIERFFVNPLPYLIILGLIGLAIWFFSLLVLWGSQAALIKMTEAAGHGEAATLALGWKWLRVDGLQLARMAIFFAFPQALLFSPFPIAAALFFKRLAPLYRAVLLGQAFGPEQLRAWVEPAAPLLIPAAIVLAAMAMIAFILSWVIGMLHQVSARAYMLEDRRVLDSIRRGWQVMRRNPGPVIVTSVFLLLTGLVFGLVFTPPLALLSGPSAPGVVVSGVYLFVVGVGLGGMLTSFHSILWTKLYQEMVEQEKATLDAEHENVSFVATANPE